MWINYTQFILIVKGQIHSCRAEEHTQGWQVYYLLAGAPGDAVIRRSCEINAACTAADVAPDHVNCAVCIHRYVRVSVQDQGGVADLRIGAPDYAPIRRVGEVDILVIITVIFPDDEDAQSIQHDHIWIILVNGWLVIIIDNDWFASFQ